MIVLPAVASDAPVCETSATATTCTFSYTGSEQSLTIPSGITQVRVSAAGAGVLQ